MRNFAFRFRRRKRGGHGRLNDRWDNLTRLGLRRCHHRLGNFSFDDWRFNAVPI